MATRRYQQVYSSSSSGSIDGEEAEATFLDEIPYDDDDAGNNSKSSDGWNIVGSFWILGLLNNSSYVIMLASAKTISDGGTGLVFLATVTPSLLIKLTAPYWFDRVTYVVRLGGASLCMGLAFGLVATSRTLPWRLLGVAFISVAGGLGEPCLLALAGRFDGAQAPAGRAAAAAAAALSPDGVVLPPLPPPPPREERGRFLTAFASGTGFAGVFGFFWKWFWNDWLRFSMSTTLWLAICIPCGYWTAFRYVMTHGHGGREVRSRRAGDTCEGEAPTSPGRYTDRAQIGSTSPRGGIDGAATSAALTLDTEGYNDIVRNRRDGQPLVVSAVADSSVEPLGIEGDESASYDVDARLGRTTVLEINKMTGRERFRLVMSLWPYMIPLFVVYAAEYTLQSGTWTAIGFPVDDVDSRNRFYQYSNWLYQAGVFVSRSSGTVFTAPMAVLWLMPALQALNVLIYWTIAASQQDAAVSVWHSPTFLYGTALYTGLLGGGVYIHGYKRICMDVPLGHREFALSATSVAESFGILLADLSGLVIQACLYRINKLDGATLTCPFE